MNVKAVISEPDAAAFLAAFERAVSLEAFKLVDLLAERAESQMRDFEDRLGHHVLSGLWTHDTVETADGAMAEVWSTAEQVTFFNRTTSARDGRVKSSVYPIDGKRLLAILEGGASEHGIAPRKPGGILTIPLRGTEELRREMRHRGPAAPEPGDTSFRKAVDHPGVHANENLATVALMIEQAAASYADNAGDAIGGDL